jgi:hypothetical protein
MENEKKIVNVSESKLRENDLDKEITCPKCKGDGCDFCGKTGSITNRKAKNFKLI